MLPTLGIRYKAKLDPEPIIPEGLLPYLSNPTRGFDTQYMALAVQPGIVQAYLYLKVCMKRSVLQIITPELLITNRNSSNLCSAYLKTRRSCEAT